MIEMNDMNSNYQQKCFINDYIMLSMEGDKTVLYIKDRHNNFIPYRRCSHFMFNSKLRRLLDVSKLARIFFVRISFIQMKKFASKIIWEFIKI